MHVVIPLLLSAAWAGAGDDLFVEWPGTSGGLGTGFGIAVADVNADGFGDVIVADATNLYLNDAGKGWTYMDLPELDEHVSQYSCSLADYDRDGRPDLASEPRGGYAILLHNEGAGDFVRIPDDEFPIAPIGQSAETDGWVDVDGDGWLDLFVPAYYGASSFYAHAGPDKAGVFHWTEMALDAGIVLSEWYPRPEGAQFCDWDRDGDADLYTAGQLLKNESTPGAFWFETADDVGPELAFDEGSAFADLDMDGDYDLGVVYHDVDWTEKLPDLAMLLWENLGDGTFVMMPPETVERLNISGGYNVGMSWADWDNDGDLDITFSDRWESNDLRESGEARFYEIATAAAQPGATPAWFDWDLDGDLDIADGNYGMTAQFFTNSLYDDVPLAERKMIRVRPVGDSADIAGGVDTEFGATVEVTVQGEAPEIRRRNFTASGHGYLNQSEYALTFGLEGTTKPVVDVSVDFANPGEIGVWRIDKYNNPALGGIAVETLENREVKVFRSGTAVIDGVTYKSTTDESALLETPGGIFMPSSPEVLTKAAEGTWIGLEVEVPLDADPDRGAALREILVDGVLGEAVTCGGVTGNVLAWDVTSGKAKLVGGTTGGVHPDNLRTDVPTDFALANGRTYRIMASVTDVREFTASGSARWLTVNGAVSDLPPDPCATDWVTEPVADSGPRAMTVRYRERVVPPVGSDTGDTGDSGTTDDSGTTTDDSTVPKETGDDSAPPGLDDGSDGDESRGCGCTTHGPMGVAWSLPLALAVLIRRRRDRTA